MVHTVSAASPSVRPRCSRWSGRHLTNQQIAAPSCTLSVRTVESHVSSLLRKLGLPDRRALAVLAATGRGAPPDADCRTS